MDTEGIMSQPPCFPGDCLCPTTDWSIVRAAASLDDDARRAALERLCLRYWYPIYAFIRRQGNDQQQSEDLTQSFFRHLLEKSDSAASGTTSNSPRIFG